MYLGRIVAVGMCRNGALVAAYRVSSRSFPNREARLSGQTVAIMPRPGFEDDLKKSPYITYNCIRTANGCAVVTNGSHTDPITEKIQMGLPPRDALSVSLLAMDYEKDSYSTPRIAAVADLRDGKGWLGIIRKDGLLVCEVPMRAGTLSYVSTYEHNRPDANFADPGFDAASPGDACEYVLRKGLFAGFEHPVTAAAALATGKDFSFGAMNA